MGKRLDDRTSDSKTLKRGTTGCEGPQPPTPPISAAPGTARLLRDFRSLAFRSKLSIVWLGKLRPRERQASHLARERGAGQSRWYLLAPLPL